AFTTRRPYRKVRWPPRWSAQSPRHAQARVRATVVGPVPVSHGGPGKRSITADRSSAPDVFLRAGNHVPLLAVLHGLPLGPGRVRPILVLAPFPSVAVYVEQPQIVRLQLPDWRLAAPGIMDVPAIGAK